MSESSSKIFAKELTRIVVEHNYLYFTTNNTVEEKAEKVATFYKTLVKNLTSDSENQ